MNDSFLSLIRQLILLLQNFDFLKLEKKVFLTLLWFYKIYIFRSGDYSFWLCFGPGSKLIGTIFSLLMTEFYVIEYTKYSLIDPSLGQ